MNDILDRNLDLLIREAWDEPKPARRPDRTWIGVAAALFIAALLGILFLPRDTGTELSSQDRVNAEALIEKLGDKDLDARDRAEDELAKMGDRIEKLLREARDKASTEVKARLDRLIHRIEVGRLGRILFGKKDGIWICDFDGTNARELVPPSSGATDEPEWSPDGKRFAFQSNRKGGHQVWIGDLDGNFQPVSGDLGRDYLTEIRWSPDGKRLAFHISGHTVGTGGVYVVDADGKNRRRITDKDKYDQPMSWSPDGTKLALSSVYKQDFIEGHDTLSVERLSEVDVVDLKTGKRTRITKTGNDVSGVAWSPDGKWIAFVTGYSLHVVPAGGGKSRRILKATSPLKEPIWSPDSRLLLSHRYGRRSPGLPGQPNKDEESSVVVVPLEGAFASYPSGASVSGLDWAPDGRSFVRVEGEKLIRVDRKTGKEQVLQKELGFWTHASWAGRR